MAPAAIVVVMVVEGVAAAEVMAAVVGHPLLVPPGSYSP